MSRLRYDGLTTTLGASLTNVATAVTFGAALTHDGGTAVPTITGSDYIPLTILDADGVPTEIVYLTAYVSGATTGTIARGKEGTSGVAHASGLAVVHSPTVVDVDGPRKLLYENVLAADAASVSFSSIPTGYDHLDVEIDRCRSTNGATAVFMLMEANGDTTAANYSEYNLYNGGTSNTSNPRIGQVVADGAPSTRHSTYRARIFDYLDTARHKIAEGRTTDSNSGITQAPMWVWRGSPAAITQLRWLMSAGDIKTGTRIRVFGVKAS